MLHVPPIATSTNGTAAATDRSLRTTAATHHRRHPPPATHYHLWSRLLPQSSLGLIGSEDFHTYFDVTPEYVARKLWALAAPFVKGARIARSHSDGLSSSMGGGGAPRRPLPPSADLAAPDLYIPLVSAWTYCVLLAARGSVWGG
ncbi:MAG: hypothetical protein DI537_54620, partial [Stutzerimonas stutzeri]